MGQLIFIILLFLGLPVAGQATWIHHSLEGGLTRAEVSYTGSDPVFAAVAVNSEGEPILPLGTRLLICGAGNCISAEVKDTGRFPAQNLDLAPATFRRLGAPLSQGRAPIVWWPLEVDRSYR